MEKSYYLKSNLLILFLILFLSFIYNALAQTFKIPDNFIEHGDRSELLDNLGLSSSKILQKIQEISKKN